MTCSNRSLSCIRIVAVVVMLATGSALAVPTVVTSVDTPSCDVLMPLTLVDELGLPTVFPVGERIDAFSGPTPVSACPATDDPNIPNVVVTIINLNPFTFFDVYYVADPPPFGGLPGTLISNEDGLVNFGQAFRIDSVGMNKPLIAESLIPDGLFQPGEAWRFVIDDYVNTLNLPPHAFLSIGVGIASPVGPSSGSIIALIPEPSLLGIAAASAPLLMARRRRN